jgi:hypothetical protein
MVAGQGSKYAIDLVICIDATGSMQPVIEEVKASALTFHQKLQAKMAKMSKQVHQLRIKVIVFRDYWEDAPDKVMVCSEFFKLPEEASAFSSFVNGIYADGGGDEPENALEALTLAIRSPWDKTQNFGKKRYVILMCTDASAHPLEKLPKPSNYPTNLPKTFDDLTDEWDALPLDPKRLVVFAPETPPWLQIEDHWENAFYFPSKAGKGLEESEIDEILEGLAGSIQ